MPIFFLLFTLCTRTLLLTIHIFGCKYHAEHQCGSKQQYKTPNVKKENSYQIWYSSRFSFYVPPLENLPPLFCGETNKVLGDEQVQKSWPLYPMVCNISLFIHCSHKTLLILGSMLIRPRSAVSGYWKPLAFFYILRPRFLRARLKRVLIYITCKKGLFLYCPVVSTPGKGFTKHISFYTPTELTSPSHQQRRPTPQKRRSRAGTQGKRTYILPKWRHHRHSYCMRPFQVAQNRLTRSSASWARYFNTQAWT